LKLIAVNAILSGTAMIGRLVRGFGAGGW